MRFLTNPSIAAVASIGEEKLCKYAWNIKKVTFPSNQIVERNDTEHKLLQVLGSKYAYIMLHHK